MHSQLRMLLGKSGLYVSNVGVGTAGISGLHGPMDEEEARSAIVYAINQGVNFIDTAPFYNNRRAETLLGDILAQFQRDHYCVATKVGRYMDPSEGTERFDYSAATTKQSVYQSLALLKVSQIDLVQIHDVEFAPNLEILLEETIPCLVQLKKKGVIRAIGITGYSTRHVRRVVERCTIDVDVVMSYLRHNLFDRSLADDLSFYKENNIGVINASPLAIGLLTNGGNVPEWNPAPDDIKAACQEAAIHCSSRGVDLARLALRHSIETPGITMTLWSSRKLQNMKLNISNASLALSVNELQVMEHIKHNELCSVQNKHWEDKLNSYRQFWEL